MPLARRLDVVPSPPQNLSDLARQLRQLRLDRDAGVIDEVEHAAQRLSLLDRRRQQRSFPGEDRRRR